MYYKRLQSKYLKDVEINQYFSVLGLLIDFREHNIANIVIF